MKKLLLYISFLPMVVISIFMTSCSKEADVEKEISIDTEASVETRGFSKDTPSTSNSNLHSNWENVSKIYLNGGGYGADAPWILNAGQVNIPWSYRSDIKSADGWRMLSHNMLDKNSADPNYMLFYNYKTGILKGFYYNPMTVLNQNLLWILKSNTSTSIFPDNDLIQSPINVMKDVVTTSNTVDYDYYRFTALQSGWNSFSFELPYGEQNNAPTVGIYGAFLTNSDITLSGKYSGEVIIPIPGRQSSSFLSTLISTVSSVAGGIPKYLKTLDTLSSFQQKLMPVSDKISKATSIIGAVFGATSWSKKTTGEMTIRATSSGTISLTGNSVTHSTGMPFWSGIELKRLNNNQDLGVWNLSQTPVYYYDKYTFAEDNLSDFGCTYSGAVGLYLPGSTKIDSFIKINPTLASEIKSYKVVDHKFFFQTTTPSWNIEELSSSIYTTDFSFEFSGGTFPAQNNEGGEGNGEAGQPYVIFKVTNPIHIPPTYINITLEIEYKDGTIFQSSRNFDITLSQVNNISLVNTWARYGNAYLVYN